MKGPSLQKTAVLSAGLHMMFVLLSFLILRQSHEMVMPSPYIVSLVGPAGETQKRGAAAETGAVSPVEKNQTTTHIEEKKELKTIDESIAALKAKRKAEEKLHQIVRLRSLVSIQGKGSRTSVKPPMQGTSSGSAVGEGEASYIDKITGQIQSHWEVPDFLRDKDLEAIVSVKIGRDGTLTVEGFEKKSGNRFYDRYVLETIQKASPVTRPQYEMEIGIRFSPKN
ncbi:MAG: energy transducer TonB [Thermodesulfovibrionales bacterium]